MIPCLALETSEPVFRPGTLNKERDQVSMAEGPVMSCQYKVAMISSVLPQRYRWPFTWVTVPWGRENAQTHQGLLDTESMLTPRKLKHQYGPSG